MQKQQLSLFIVLCSAFTSWWLRLSVFIVLRSAFTSWWLRLSLFIVLRSAFTSWWLRLSVFIVLRSTFTSWWLWLSVPYFSVAYIESNTANAARTTQYCERSTVSAEVRRRSTSEGRKEHDEQRKSKPPTGERRTQYNAVHRKPKPPTGERRTQYNEQRKPKPPTGERRTQYDEGRMSKTINWRT